MDDEHQKRDENIGGSRRAEAMSFEAIERLFERHYQELLRYAFAYMYAGIRLDSQEANGVLNGSLISMIASNKLRPPLDQDERFLPFAKLWLSGDLRNYIRKEKIRRPGGSGNSSDPDDVSEDDPLSSNETPREILEREESFEFAAAAMRRHLGEIEPKCRQTAESVVGRIEVGDLDFWRISEIARIAAEPDKRARECMPKIRAKWEPLFIALGILKP